MTTNSDSESWELFESLKNESSFAVAENEIYVTDARNKISLIIPNSSKYIDKYIHIFTTFIKKDLVKKILEVLTTLSELEGVDHFKLNSKFMSFNTSQLNEFVEKFKSVKTPDVDIKTQFYICEMILHPELNGLIDLFDSDSVKMYNCRILDDTYNWDSKLSFEEKLEKIKIGKIVLHDYDLSSYYYSASEEEKKEYLDFHEILSQFGKLHYNTCCGREPGDAINYYKVFLTIPQEKRKQIANYILKANYKSLSMAKDIADYFSTISFEEMETRFNRAKSIWPDCHIHSGHQFERFFVSLLKLDYIPSESEVVDVAKGDMETRNDIDYCYWGYETASVINEVTRRRLGLQWASEDEESLVTEEDYECEKYDECDDFFSKVIKTHKFKKNNCKMSKAEFYKAHQEK